MADIFVSYARTDKARVAPLVAALESRGWSVWWDPAIVPGEEFDDLITQQIDQAQAVVVVWTTASVASRWVRGEARLAADRGVLVPVRFDRARLPIDALALHTTDLDDWKEDVGARPFQDLLAALSKHLKSAPRTTVEERRTAVCVLPFTNMSGDTEQEYFSDGITEDIITDLGKVSALCVTSRNSAFCFKGKPIDMKQVARQLGVTHVVEGSVRKAGNRVRITAQLIDAAQDSHLWAERYDRDLSDVFALQDEISRAIVAALKLTLLPEEKQAIEARGTDNLEAYDLYLRARALRSTLGAAESLRSTELYRRALALDPRFAHAWAGLADALGYCSIFYREMVTTARPEMEAATSRALALAPDLAEIRASQARLSLMRQEWLAMDENLSLAADAGGYREYMLAVLGRAREAVEDGLKARRTDPLSITMSFTLQLCLDINGRLDEAEAEYARSKDLPGDRAVVEWRAVTRMMALKDARLKERLTDLVIGGWSWMAFDAELLKVLDQPGAALEIVSAAFRDPLYQDGARMGAIASWAAYYGDKDLAFQALRRGFVDMHSQTIIEIWHPIFRELRQDPRFKDFVRDLGLYDYWRKSGKWGDFARAKGGDDFEIVG